MPFQKNRQYIQFCAYGFLKNLRFFDAFLLLFFIEKGLTYTQIGMLYACREIVINLFEIPSGIIADTFGRKSSLLGSFLFYILSFVVFYLFADFWFLLLAMICYGIGDAFRSGTHKGMIMDYLKLRQWGQYKVDYYGHTRSWSQKGSALSALIAGLLVFYDGSYQNIFLYSIFPYVLNLGNIATYPKDLNYALGQGKAQKKIGSTFKSFTQIIRQPPLLMLINSSALHSSFLKAIKDYIQPLLLHIATLLPFLMYADAKEKSGLVIGLIYSCIFLLNSWASKSAAKLASIQKGNLPQLTLIAGLLAGLISGVLFVMEWWWFALFAFVAIYVIENLRKPILTGAVANKVPSEILTSVLSAQSFLGTILTALLALSIGIMVDHWGIGLAFIFLSSGLLVFLLILTNVFRKEDTEVDVI